MRRRRNTARVLNRRMILPKNRFSGSCVSGRAAKTDGRAVGKERNPARGRSRRHADRDRPFVGRTVPAAAQESALSFPGADSGCVRWSGAAEAGASPPASTSIPAGFLTARRWSSGCARSMLPAAGSSWPPARRANSPRRSQRILACSTPSMRPTAPTISRRSRKCAALVAAYGDGGFDYAGNSRHDLACFDVARAAIVVAPDRHAARWQSAHGCRTVRDAEADRQDLSEDAARPSMGEERADRRADGAVARIFQHRHGRGLPARLRLVQRGGLAVYIVNDFFDLALDRRHPTKRKRPFASGVLSIPFGLRRGGGAALDSAVAAAFLPPLFWRARRLHGHHHGLFAVDQADAADRRADAGRPLHDAHPGRRGGDRDRRLVLAAGILDLLLPVAGAGEALRRAAHIDALVGERIAGRGYRTEDQEIVAQAGMASAFSSALVLALYIDSDAVKELYPHPWLVWPRGADHALPHHARLDTRPPRRDA